MLNNVSFSEQYLVEQKMTFDQFTTNSLLVDRLLLICSVNMLNILTIFISDNLHHNLATNLEVEKCFLAHVCKIIGAAFLRSHVTNRHAA